MRRSAPPNMQAKQPRSVGMRSVISPTFDDPHALVMRGIGDPDAARFVEADAVRRDTIEVGPHPTVRQRAVRGDVERGETTAEGLTHDERGSVGRDHGAVREHQVVRRRRHRAVGSDERERRGLRCFAVGEVEAEVADVGPPRDRRRPCRCSRRSRHHSGRRARRGLQGRAASAARSCIDTTSRRPSGSHPNPEGRFGTSTIVSAVAVLVHRLHSMRVEVGEPETAVVPAGALAEREAVEDDLGRGGTRGHPVNSTAARASARDGMRLAQRDETGESGGPGGVHVDSRRRPGEVVRPPEVVLPDRDRGATRAQQRIDDRCPVVGLVIEDAGGDARARLAPTAT